MKTIRLLLPLLLLITMSCKKNDDKVPEKKEDPVKADMDISQYYIVIDHTFTLGSKSFIHPLLIVFDKGGKAGIYDFGAAGNGQYSYVFANNVITIDIGSGLSWVFKINNESIASTEGISTADNKNFRLYKVPATNQFKGNVYSGVLIARENNSGMPFKYVFNETQFGESVIDPPSLTYAYTAIKNVAAVTTIDRVIRYFLIVDGRLVISRYDLDTSTPSKFYYGSLSKD